jgi:hypothetical protein
VEVVPGSATGELNGLGGWFQFAAGHGRTMEIEFSAMFSGNCFA